MPSVPASGIQHFSENDFSTGQSSNGRWGQALTLEPSNDGNAANHQQEVDLPNINLAFNLLISVLHRHTREDAKMPAAGLARARVAQSFGSLGHHKYTGVELPPSQLSEAILRCAEAAGVQVYRMILTWPAA